MQPSHAVYLKIVHRVSLSKCKKPFEQSETIAIPPIATHPGGGSALASLIHAEFWEIQFFFGKQHSDDAAVLS
jgi:hypothetical protein